MTTRHARIRELTELRDRINQEITELEYQTRLEHAAAQKALKTANLCGTPGGYTRHRRTLREPACDACKTAHAAYEAQRAARAKATA